MGSTHDVQDVLRAAVLTVLALVTGYHLARLVRRPVGAVQAAAVDAAHALMGGVMLLMLAGRVGRDAGIGWAAVFVVLGVAGAFSRSRAELVIGSAAMVLMLAAAPAPTAAAASAMDGMHGMDMTGMTGMNMATAGPSIGPATRILVVLLVLALLTLTAVGLLHARSTGTETGLQPRVAVACRLGLNLATVYMLVLMV